MNGIFDNDTLLGGPGNDLLRDPSPLDQDSLFGGPDRDTLDARDGDGNDLVDGGPGSDDCSGDQNDRFVDCERIQRLPALGERSAQRRQGSIAKLGVFARSFLHKRGSR
jgi:Ca2+-binding RTX toxin-like protein